VSAGGLTDTPACCPRWSATTAGAARHPEQTVVRLLLLARWYVALQHCPLEHIFIPAGGLCPGVTVGEWLSAPLTASWIAEATNYNTTVRHGMSQPMHHATLNLDTGQEETGQEETGQQ
jgi:hypothetical protein